MARCEFGSPQKMFVAASPLSDARPWDEVPIRDCKSEDFFKKEDTAEEKLWQGTDVAYFGKDITVTATIDTQSKEYAVSVLRYCLTMYRKIRRMTGHTLIFDMSAPCYKTMQKLSHRAYNMNFKRFLKAHGIKAKFVIFK